jgi:hypothetical protein
MTPMRLVSTLVLVALIGLAGPSLDANPPAKAKGPAVSTTVPGTPKARTESIDKAVASLTELIAQPAPRGLSSADQQQWAEQTKWLTSLKERYSSFGQSQGLNGGDLVQEMASMNTEFLALQAATQKESRRFQTLSTASKARHDLAMNAIRNIK